MKVLKFGGTSVASCACLSTLKTIVEQESGTQDVVVVVSAVGGITDRLHHTALLAAQGDEEWEDEYDGIAAQHTRLIGEVFPSGEKRETLLSEINALLEQLRSIYFGVYLIRDLSAKTRDTILSYGERLSSRIIATLLREAKWMDSREFVKTTDKGGKRLIHSELTAKLIQQAFADRTPITLVPGFIASDKDTGETTTLGRGGSDYTASLIAAALDADVLEIWTDVDGFMTADPHIIKTAYTINELSYVEAMELCNFGAKVIYPPTIYPVCVKNIPIRVKNTFNPTGAGTLIKENVSGDGKLIRGISSISGSALVHISGLSMVGVIGVNQRIFTALTDNDISVFMVAQASSENSTSIGVRTEDAAKAAEVLNEEFSKEIATGAMFPMKVETGLATVAIVGENMRHHANVSGKLFSVLGRAGISVIAFAQGAAGTNISFVVKEQSLRKSLNVIHDSFFLSEYNVLNLFICGVGTVGGMLLEQIRTQYELLKETRHLELNVVGIASSKKAIYSRDGIDLNEYKSLADCPEDSNTEKLVENVIGMNIFNSVFVDCTSSPDIAASY
ncbi:MAG: aspartate kinase, partial [Bacteroidales bacterium]|nr:aspartate kinase [Bacteroidales bacterium]